MLVYFSVKLKITFNFFWIVFVVCLINTTKLWPQFGKDFRFVFRLTSLCCKYVLESQLNYCCFANRWLREGWYCELIIKGNILWFCASVHYLRTCSPSSPNWWQAWRLTFHIFLSGNKLLRSGALDVYAKNVSNIVLLLLMLIYLYWLDG